MAKKEKNGKTNAMRIVEAAGIDFQISTYDASGGFVSGTAAAEKAGIPLEMTYKTLVTVSTKNEYFVCVIPAASELDLKKAARHFGVKKIEMLPQKDLTQVTGYVKGGCSPVGMKKSFPTAIDRSAEELPAMYVSGGKVGMQMRLRPRDLADLVDAAFADLTEEQNG